MSHNRLEQFVIDGDWRGQEDERVTDRAGMGESLAREYNTTPELFRYLQTLIAQPDAKLPYDAPFVRIVTAKDGWKQDFALVYGFPAHSSEASVSHGPSAYATRSPEEAAMFKIYYGSNHGPAGYKQIKIAQALDPELESRLRAGDFIDDEAEQLLESAHGLSRTYDELLIAARNPELNPEYAVRVNEAFYRDADDAGL